MEEPKQMPKSVALAIGLTFATIGIIAMIAGVLWYRSTKERLKTMINHIGIVVEMIRVERPGETATSTLSLSSRRKQVKCSDLNQEQGEVKPHTKLANRLKFYTTRKTHRER